MKPTIILLSVLLLLSNGVSSINCSTIPENSTDMLSLLDFKEAITSGQNGALSSWNRNTSFCKWRGVHCNQRYQGRATMLNLAGQGLSGPIAASVGNLTFLHTLDLSNNQFSGQIPPLNSLWRLQFLNLSQNALDGSIPDTLTNCSKLRELGLNANFLGGTITPKIGLLSNLVTLTFNQNSLSGNIPVSIGNCTHLKTLDLGSNNLEGNIPDELGQLLNLTTLSVSINQLSGAIPLSLLNLHSLQILSLDTNRLVNELPSNIGNELPNLLQLLLGDNAFEGHIPASLGNALGLQKIDLSINNFTGPIPTSLGKLSKLVKLNLQKNSLEAWDNQSWEFLTALRTCTLLQLLSLSYNRLQGVVPDSIGNLSPNLQFLYLTGNNLSGVVPPSIGNLKGLIELTLGSNSLNGTIEGSIGSMTSLQFLHLQENNFVGPIPSDLGNLTQLLSLVLAENRFDGIIPSDLGKLTKIVELDFSYNMLKGNIPEEVLSLTKLQFISLSNNNLDGIIPSDLGKLQTLTELDLQSNKLTGGIPSSLGQCQALEIIQINQNLLTGNIPVSFGNIVSLSFLNLSHNNLSGMIPTNLSTLQHLIRLDISYNHLQGVIPTTGVFANVTAVSLQGNWGLCGGATELRMPPCTTISKRVERKYYLIKILIPIFGFMSLILLIYFILLEKKTSKEKYLSLSPFGNQFPKVTYSDLAQTTKNFSDSCLIGRGSYGSVYRGKLKNPEMEVAVKVFNLEMRGAERSFMSECEALRSIQHRNLLHIITACSTVDSIGNVFKALVYEFMPNGSLDTWLHKKEDGKATKRLGLAQRINIIVNIADVLDYLHNECGRPTIHCDLKPSNILLDDDMNALLGDFGIASFYVDSQPTSIGCSSSIGVKGTIGYIAPEYAGGGRRASTSGDVYSFGILLLEMMTDKRPTDPIFKDGLDIVKFVENNFPHQISIVIDDSIMEEWKNFTEENTVAENEFYQIMLSLLQVALSCTRPLPNERRNIKEIASQMHAIKASYLGWKAKK